MDDSMCFDRSDSDEGAMKFSEPYENGSSMYAGDLKQTDNHVPCPIPPTAIRNIRKDDVKDVEAMGLNAMLDITVKPVLVLLHYVNLVLNPIM